MKHVDQEAIEERSFLLTAVIYYMVMLVGLVVGLYGLFSLFSLATSQILRAVSRLALTFEPATPDQ